MAELVDALVSNTSGFTSMPVRSRLWVLTERVFNFLRFSFYPSLLYRITFLLIPQSLYRISGCGPETMPAYRK